jgi:hypothetical protein
MKYTTASAISAAIVTKFIQERIAQLRQASWTQYAPFSLNL